VTVSAFKPKKNDRRCRAKFHSHVNPRRSSGGFQLESFVGHWPRRPPLLCWFRLPQAYFRNPRASPGRGSNVRNAPYRVWRRKNPVLEAVMQSFSDFHQGPPRTIWQGPRRPLYKWPLLKSAPEQKLCSRRRTARCAVSFSRNLLNCCTTSSHTDYRVLLSGKPSFEDDTIRYDTRCYFNAHSKADMSQLNLPHGNN